MFSKAVAAVAGGLWALAAAAQTPQITMVPRALAAPKAEPRQRDWLNLHEWLKGKVRIEGQAAVCSIPLTKVPVRGDIDPMLKFRPPAPVEPMPFVPLPAPPCEEKKR